MRLGCLKWNSGRAFVRKARTIGARPSMRPNVSGRGDGFPRKGILQARRKSALASAPADTDGSGEASPGRKLGSVVLSTGVLGSAWISREAEPGRR